MIPINLLIRYPGFRFRHIPVSSIRYYRAVDMSKPHTWFPHARRITRKIICHIGPTNSGKTFAALQQLKKAKRGIYCGPLRLLAWEICNVLRDAGSACNLVTGQETELAEEASHTSCTVEMCDIYSHFDCAVIDEFQLIGDDERGWAWSRAFLGLRAAEIHVCG